jgi:hypothetical protein
VTRPRGVVGARASRVLPRVTTTSPHSVTSRRARSDLLADWLRWSVFERAIAVAMPVLSMFGAALAAVLLAH